MALPTEEDDAEDLEAEFAQQQAYEEGLQRWAEMYDELNGAPENEEDR